MANNRYVTVNITQSKPEIIDESMGRILILGTSKAVPFTVLDAEGALEDLKDASSFGATSAEYKIAEKILGQERKVKEIAVLGVTYAEDETVLTTALDNAIKSGNDFYYLVSPVQTIEGVLAFAGWVGTKKGKVYAASLNPATYSESLTNLPRTFLLVHDKASEQYPAEAWVGECAARPTGTYAWKFKTLKGVDPYQIGDTGITNLHKKNANSYIRVSGYNITSNDVMLDGEYIDVIQTIDYLESRIAQAVFSRIIALEKVPFTQTGIDVIEGAIAGVLQGSPDGMLSTDDSGNKLYTVTMPKIETITGADKLKRVLKGIKFRFTIAGAIGEVEVNGVLEY